MYPQYPPMPGYGFAPAYPAYPAPISMQQYPPYGYPPQQYFGQTQTGKKPLPATVTTAGILLLIYGFLTFVLITATLIGNASDIPLWSSILTYLGSVLSLAAPIFMLQRKQWAYSMCFSLVLAMVIALLFEAVGLFGDVAVLQIAALPILVIVFVVALAIIGTPLLLLTSKSARRAFERDRNPSAVVWAGGGFQQAWEEPFALHPSELPPSMFMAMRWAPPPPMTYAYTGGLGPPPYPTY